MIRNSPGTRDYSLLLVVHVGTGRLIVLSANFRLKNDRNRQGEESSQIELATKILTSQGLELDVLRLTCSSSFRAYQKHPIARNVSFGFMGDRQAGE